MNCCIVLNMDELINPTPKKPSFSFKNGPSIRTWIFVLVGMEILLLFVIAYLNITAYRSKIHYFERSVTLLATALGPLVVHPDQRVLTDLTVPVAEAGKFALVLVTDATGKVIATTDRRFDHQIIPSLAKISYPADAQNINGRLRLDCAVLYQGQHVGALRVEVSSSAF